MTRPRIGHPLFGTVCGCGGRKSKQAFKCQGCRTVEKRSVAQYLDRRHGSARVVGRPDPAGLRAALNHARSCVDGELAVLVAAQERDERSFRIGTRWTVSLDEPSAFKGRTWREVIAA